MRYITTIIFFLIFALSTYGQKYQYPGPLDFKTFKIGQKIDTTLFKKYSDTHFPNYLDGWKIENQNQLLEKYIGLPIAIWIQKNDSSVALTLLNDRVLNITVSYITETEKNKITSKLIQKFGSDGVQKSFEETHPLQSWITYWDLKTWETDVVIVQLGYSYIGKPNDPLPKDIRWNLVYSDFLIEDNIIDEYKKNLFSNKEDSLKYFSTVNRFKNRAHPPENGLFKDYFENGKIKEKGIYENAKKNGLWEIWFENGQKADEAFYKDDELIGKRLTWHLNGQLELESYWGKSNDRIGKWIKYYENGQIESITNFNDKGELDGKELQYFKNGKIKSKTTYKRNSIIKDILYDELGNQVK